MEHDSTQDDYIEEAMESGVVFDVRNNDGNDTGNQVFSATTVHGVTSNGTGIGTATNSDNNNININNTIKSSNTFNENPTLGIGQTVPTRSPRARTPIVNASADNSGNNSNDNHDEREVHESPVMDKARRFELNTSGNRSSGVVAGNYRDHGKASPTLQRQRSPRPAVSVDAAPQIQQQKRQYQQQQQLRQHHQRGTHSQQQLSNKNRDLEHEHEREREHEYGRGHGRHHTTDHDYDYDDYEREHEREFESDHEDENENMEDDPNAAIELESAMYTFDAMYRGPGSLVAAAAINTTTTAANVTTSAATVPVPIAVTASALGPLPSPIGSLHNAVVRRMPRKASIRSACKSALAARSQPPPPSPSLSSPSLPSSTSPRPPSTLLQSQRRQQSSVTPSIQRNMATPTDGARKQAIRNEYSNPVATRNPSQTVILQERNRVDSTAVFGASRGRAQATAAAAAPIYRDRVGMPIQTNAMPYNARSVASTPKALQPPSTSYHAQQKQQHQQHQQHQQQQQQQQQQKTYVAPTATAYNHLQHHHTNYSNQRQQQTQNQPPQQCQCSVDQSQKQASQRSQALGNANRYENGSLLLSPTARPLATSATNSSGNGYHRSHQLRDRGSSVVSKYQSFRNNDNDVEHGDNIDKYDYENRGQDQREDEDGVFNDSNYRIKNDSQRKRELEFDVIVDDIDFALRDDACFGSMLNAICQYAWTMTTRGIVSVGTLNYRVTVNQLRLTKRRVIESIIDSVRDGLITEPLDEERLEPWQDYKRQERSWTSLTSAAKKHKSDDSTGQFAAHVRAPTSDNESDRNCDCDHDRDHQHHHRHHHHLHQNHRSIYNNDNHHHNYRHRRTHSDVYESCAACDQIVSGPSTDSPIIDSCRNCASSSSAFQRHARVANGVHQHAQVVSPTTASSHHQANHVSKATTTTTPTPTITTTATNIATAPGPSSISIGRADPAIVVRIGPSGVPASTPSLTSTATPLSHPTTIIATTNTIASATTPATIASPPVGSSSRNGNSLGNGEARANNASPPNHPASAQSKQQPLHQLHSQPAEASSQVQSHTLPTLSSPTLPRSQSSRRYLKQSRQHQPAQQRQKRQSSAQQQKQPAHQVSPRAIVAQAINTASQFVLSELDNGGGGGGGGDGLPMAPEDPNGYDILNIQLNHQHVMIEDAIHIMDAGTTNNINANDEDNNSYPDMTMFAHLLDPALNEITPANADKNVAGPHTIFTMEEIGSIIESTGMNHSHEYGATPIITNVENASFFSAGAGTAAIANAGAIASAVAGVQAQEALSNNSPKRKPKQKKPVDPEKLERKKIRDKARRSAAAARQRLSKGLELSAEQIEAIEKWKQMAPSKTDSALSNALSSSMTLSSSSSSLAIGVVTTSSAAITAESASLIAQELPSTTSPNHAEQTEHAIENVMVTGELSMDIDMSAIGLNEIHDAATVLSTIDSLPPPNQSVAEEIHIISNMPAIDSHHGMEVS